MERSEVLKRICSKNTSINDFKWDSLYAPNLLSFITVDDVFYLSKLASSIKYSSKIDYKYSEIDRILTNRGFVKLSAGTNRVCYRYLENDSIVLKVAIDDVGKKDNPREYKNQFYLKPYVTKIFEVSPCGVVALVERVDNIKSREEFKSIAGDIYDVISNWIIGKYVLEDIGTKYFLNWGVRPNFGPVLLDFPYMYELDGEKLFCNLPINNTGELCDGVIDYDIGYNYLYCTKCNTVYKAIELKKALEDNTIITQGKVGSKMKVSIKVAGKETKIIDPSKVAKKITKLEEKHNNRKPIGSDLKVKDTRPGTVVIPEEVKEYVANSNKVETPQEPVLEKKRVSVSFGKKEELPVEEDEITIGTFGNDTNLVVGKVLEAASEFNEEMDEELIDAIIKAAEEEEEEIDEESEDREEDDETEEESIGDSEEADDEEKLDDYDGYSEEENSDEEDENSECEENDEESINDDEDSEDEDNVDGDESDEDVVEEYEIPVGAAPPTIKVKERSKKFNSEFYEN